MAQMHISAENSVFLLQAKDILVEARRLKPGAARNELRAMVKVLRELAKLDVEPQSSDLDRRTGSDRVSR